MPNDISLTPSAIVAEAERTLVQAGYSVSRGHSMKLPTIYHLLAEDLYGVVAILVFDTWADLYRNWPEAQGILVDLLSSKLTPDDPKAWDGYLVLLTLAQASPSQLRECESIRYDTSRIRKLVFTANDLTTLRDVQTCLRSLLPLDVTEEISEPQSTLDLIPSLLAERGQEEEAVRVIIDAFRKNEPILQKLHEYESNK